MSIKATVSKELCEDMSIWFVQTKEKEIPKCYIPKKNRHHIHLPLKIPQNIIDTLQRYWDWRQEVKDNPKHYEDKYPYGTKDAILNDLAKVAKRWHLYAGFEAIAGTFFIYTKVGVTIHACFGDHQNPPYHQCTNGYDEAMGRAPAVDEKMIDGHYYKYIWDKNDGKSD